MDKDNFCRFITALLVIISLQMKLLLETLTKINCSAQMHLLQMAVKCYIFSYCNQYSSTSEDYMYSVFLPKSPVCF